MVIIMKGGLIGDEVRWGAFERSRVMEVATRGDDEVKVKWGW